MMQDANPFDQFDTPPSQGGVTTIVAGKPKEKTRILSQEEMAGIPGLDPTKVYQVAPGGAISAISDQRGSGGRKAEAELRKEFNAQAEVKDFRAIRQSYRQIRELGKTNNAQNDIAMIFSYMKMLDPGSVVREGEFAQAQNAAGVPDQIRNMYNKALSGERLNDTQRANMIATAESVYDRTRRSYNDRVEEYRGYASDYDLVPDRVAKIVDIEPEQQKNDQPDKSAPLPAPGAREDVEVSPTGEMRFSTDADNAFAAKVQALFDKGATAEQIRGFAANNGYPNAYNADLDRAITFRDKGGKGARIMPPQSGYRPPSAVGAAAATPLGSYFGGAANALTAGMLDEAAGALGGDAEQAQFAKLSLIHI